MSREKEAQSVGRVEWFLVGLFFVIIAVIFWAVNAKSDLVTGYVFPIALIVLVLYFGIRYCSEQGKMIKAIKEFQKDDL